MVGIWGGGPKRLLRSSFYARIVSISLKSILTGAISRGSSRLGRVTNAALVVLVFNGRRRARAKSDLNSFIRDLGRCEGEGGSRYLAASNLGEER
ncbi:hypothetical protein UPYG_G00048630 [Umbra pygmaea]|uniref:Uncharacterized protein n=1 Tax=Umbra pygmaea TaxID=75934 RepID=A0ABD0XSW7_UMBPY